MSSVNIQLAADLVGEVREVAESERLLEGARHSGPLRFEYGGSTLTCDVRNVSEYLDSIDVQSPDTPYVCLEEEFLSKVERCYHMIQSYGSEEVSDLMRKAIDAISNGINKSERVKSFAEDASRVSNASDSRELLSHVRTTIARHLAAVTYARALTLSKRYGPTELLFNAYNAGLFVFGWDWEVEGVLCVNPAQARR